MGRTMTTTDREAYSVNEARQKLGGISRKTIYDLINSGDLVSFTLGRRRLISGNAIREYVRTQERRSVQSSNSA